MSSSSRHHPDVVERLSDAHFHRTVATSYPGDSAAHIVFRIVCMTLKTLPEYTRILNEVAAASDAHVRG